ncbi:polynucleotide adenylyltransferase [Polynucleobacter sp. HIN5]|uniref:polynucleotide adenylyltransferase n=1 Tax=Polynucleobacter sp. HIN5 TaxID=3047864 RepID=UPI002573EDD8|nr:polynucleotide adenylyltransferase [Polynucleobacter sp. HIN5]BEI34426.1 CCA-adding protein [Polynucleobacter sp. HIN5]
MKIYQVGGAVRDRLLGRAVHDVDYVVVGTTADEMMQKGFRPVGSHFPVFLHPITNAEYALARTERKTAPGHQGFTFHADPSVTLEEDLQRRDLTINAMAQEVNKSGEPVGEIVDPYGGQADLGAGVLRHVSNAFLEDPLRVLRVTRFAARFPDFQIAPETLILMRRMVEARELETLSKERIWQELARAMEETEPLRFIETLNQCNALADVLPASFEKWWHQEELQKSIRHAMHLVVAARPELNQRIACLLRTIPPAEIQEWARGSKVPNEIAEYCQIAADFESVHSKLIPTDILAFFNRADLWRKPHRITELLTLFEALGIDMAVWQKLVSNLMGIDAGQIAKSVSQRSNTNELGKAIHAELERVRLLTIQEALS